MTDPAKPNAPSPAPAAAGQGELLLAILRAIKAGLEVRFLRDRRRCATLVEVFGKPTGIEPARGVTLYVCDEDPACLAADLARAVEQATKRVRLACPRPWRPARPTTGSSAQ